MLKTLLSMLLVLPVATYGYVGSYEPTPLRNVATIKFIDSQAAGASCVMELTKKNPAYALMSPLMIQLMECVIYDDPLTIIAPITLGPGVFYGLSHGATPNALLGHGLRHAFDGADWHHTMLPQLDDGWVRRTDCRSDRSLSSTEYQFDVRREAESTQKQIGMRPKVGPTEILTCTFFIDSCKVSYEDLGELVKACLSD